MPNTTHPPEHLILPTAPPEAWRDAVAAWERALTAGPPAQLAAVLHRNLGLSAYNDSADPADALDHYRQALIAAPRDARLWFEQDQLSTRVGVSSERLRRLEQHRELVALRDDLTTTFANLLLDVGRTAEARSLLAERTFQPWEGGEGQVLAVWDRACLAEAHQYLKHGNAAQAVALVHEALHPPGNLGEDRHPLANTAQLYLALGDALAGLKEHDAAIMSWERAARSNADFVDMEQTTFNSNTIYAAAALVRLGRCSEANELVTRLEAWLEEQEKAEVYVDFFATSLPSMLLFVDDPVAARDREVAHIQEQIDTWKAGDER